MVSKFVGLSLKIDKPSIDNGKTMKKEVKMMLVDDFKYLGTFLKSSSDDFQHRKKLGWSACIKLRHLWKDQGLSRKIKRKITIKFFLFSSTIESILFYNSITWTLRETPEKSINDCYSRLLRYALDIN